jgi:hypothetical protein
VIGPMKRRDFCGVLSIDMIWRDIRRTRVVSANSDTRAEALAIRSQRIRYELGVASQDGCVAVCQETVLGTQKTDNL